MRGGQSSWRREQSEQTLRGRGFGEPKENRKWHHLVLNMNAAKGEMWLDQIEGWEIGRAHV